MHPPPTGLEIEGPLASGASSNVWLARLHGEPLALKRLRPELRDDPLAAAGFGREVRAAGAVGSPHVMRIVAHGEDPDGPWIASTHVPGPTLRELGAQGEPLDEPDWRRIALGLARGLAALHEAGFLHGDLKPENARLDEHGEAVWLDLGFARPFAEAHAPDAPRPGSLAYLAPEQARDRAADAPSEAFSLGLVLRELATGEHPFAPALRGGSSELLAALAGSQLGPASELNPCLSPFADALLEDLLSPEPGARPSAATLAARLEEGEAGPWWQARLDAPLEDPEVPHGSLRVHPLVGREPVLQRLAQLWERVLEGEQGAVAWLTGEIGSGKSRLVHELARRLRRTRRPPLFLVTQAAQASGSHAPDPLLETLARSLGAPARGVPGPAAQERLRALVPARDAQTLLDAFEPSSERDERTDVPGALARAFAALGRRERLILFVDDVGRANEATLEVLARIAELLDGTRTLVVLGLREEIARRNPRALAELRTRVAGAPEEVQVEIGPLGENAVRELVARTFDETTPRLELARRLRERSQGNAGLMTEILRGLVARGEALVEPDGRLRLLIAPHEIPWPATLREAILESYRALPAGDRRWLGRLAVAGANLSQAFLRRAFPEAGSGEIDEVLSQFLGAGWIEAHGERYRFARPALRRAVYAELPSAERRRAHESMAGALVPTPGASIPLSDAYLLAYHLRAARRNEALVRWIRALLPRLFQRGQTRRVHTLSTWGLEALDALPPSPERAAFLIDLLEAAADASDRLGHRDAQRRALDRLAELPIDPREQPLAAGRIYLLHGRYALSVGRYALAGSMLRHAVTCFEEAGADGLCCDALRRQAALHTHLGDLEPARALALRARELAPDVRRRALAEIALGVVHVNAGELEQALRGAERALRSLHSEPRQEVEGIRAHANLLRARAYRNAGRPRRALASAQRALREARGANERRLEAEASARLGGHLLDLDLVGEAEERVRDALRLSREIEDRRGEAMASLFLGILLAEEDRAGADALLSEAHELALSIGLHALGAVARAIQARRLLQAGQPEDALRASTEAMRALGSQSGELMDRAVVTGTHVLMLRTCGRSEEAAELEHGLRRLLRRANRAVESAVTRRRQRLASVRLLEASLSPLGPVFPRVRLSPGVKPGALEVWPPRGRGSEPGKARDFY